MELPKQKAESAQAKHSKTKRSYSNISASLAKLMALPNAPQLPANPSARQQAAYNGYWLGVMARYRDVVSLQKWKGDKGWLPEFSG